MTVTKTDNTPVTTASTTSADETEPVGSTRAERLSALVQQHGALAVLVIVSVIASFSFDSFATSDNVTNMATSSAFLAIVALGMTFVIITGGIDLSVGSLFALGGVLAAWGSRHGTLVALLLPLAVCGLIGVVNGLLVARSRLAPFIVTLAAMLGARGLMLSLTDEGANTYLIAKGSFLAELGQGTTLGVGNPVWLMLALFVAGAVVLRRTRFGQHVYAVGGNEDAAALMGAPVARTKILVYTLSGLLAGLAAPSTRPGSPPASPSSATAWSWRPSPPSSSAARCSPAASATSAARWSASCCSR